MQSVKRYVLSVLAVTVLAFSLLVLHTQDARAAGVNLTGVWHTQTGATFYVRQIDSPTGSSQIFWYGMQSPVNPAWTNVASGQLFGNVVSVQWADVPIGQTRSSGTLSLQVVAPNHLVVVNNPNGFLTADWFR